MSMPLKRISPRVGSRNLVSRLKQVVLPAPLGTDQRVDMSAPDLQVHAIHSDETTELLDETRGLENAIFGHQALFGLAGH
jgi:hypothetical protein